MPAWALVSCRSASTLGTMIPHSGTCTDPRTFWPSTSETRRPALWRSTPIRLAPVGAGCEDMVTIARSNPSIAVRSNWLAWPLDRAGGSSAASDRRQAIKPAPPPNRRPSWSRVVSMRSFSKRTSPDRLDQLSRKSALSSRNRFRWWSACGEWPRGVEGETVARSLVDRGASILGINCRPDLEDAFEFARQSNGIVGCPLLVKPSANRSLAPEFDAAQFAMAVPGLLAFNVRLLGGCCGTTDLHVAALSAACRLRKSVPGNRITGARK